MSEITVRAARPGDGGSIALLSHDSGAYYRELAPDDFRVPDEDGQRGIALVAVLDGEVAGYLEARLEEPLESACYQTNPELAERRLFVDALLTARSHWRRGVGSTLVEAAEAWGRERGATLAVMDTYADSPVSVPFWRGAATARGP